ncbi:multicopper oxidase family protein [Mesorhizobium sp. ZMM04-5]|uniref:Multicopper oxidase family protein n=1 Tax=Mesorhizobium marinum TaxID=3228790 RepID=A0ABV3R3B1_9HYPH
MTRMNRRRFLAGSAAVAAALTTTHPRIAGASQPQRQLRAETRVIDVNGRAATVFGLRDETGRHGLAFDAGERFAVRFANRSGEPTLVHWHGLTPPWRQDGTPDISAPLLASGEEATYDFALARPGTNWMHAHTLQEQRLMAAPLIVRDPSDKGIDEQEVVVLFHDFSFTAPEELLAKLDGSGGMDHGAMDHGSMNHMAMGQMDMGEMETGQPATDHAAMGHGGMTMDVNDIEFDAYLANDRTLDDPEVISVEQGGRVRLRLINGSAATNYTLDLGALEGDLVAVDGMPIVPLRGRRFAFGIAQRLDIRLQLPRGTAAFPILALREGAAQRSGLLLAPTGAAVAKLPVQGDATGPIVGLSLERQLRAVAPLSVRRADRRIEIALAGTMQGYRWALEAMPDPFRVGTGERVEIAMTNTSMMSHPMHLHGHHFQVTEIDGETLSGAVRDTVVVPPMSRVTIAFDADNAGNWAFHCHHLYHMVAGMMGRIEYEQYS